MAMGKVGGGFVFFGWCGRRGIIVIVSRSFPALDHLALHRDRALSPMELIVKTTRIADCVSRIVSSPERGCRSPTVETAHHINIF